MNLFQTPRWSLCVVRGILAFVVFAVALGERAEAKPAIAVLGLEVTGGEGLDRATLQVAERLVKVVRAMVDKEPSPYQLAPDGAKDLLELKLLSNCSDEGRGCMSEIGRELGAERLLYGKIRRHRERYEVSLNLLNVDTRRIEEQITDDIAVEDLAKDSSNDWFGSLYLRLIGIPTERSLVIETNGSDGTVYVDGTVATTLRGGTATVRGLKEGVHTIRITTPDFEDHQEQVEIHEDAKQIFVTFLPRATTSPSKVGWKVAFGGAAIATVTFAGAAVYSWMDYRGPLTDDKNEAWAAIRNPDAVADISRGNNAEGAVINDACGKAKSYSGTSDPTLENFIKACDAGEDAATRTNLFLVGTFIGAAATAYLGYQIWLADGGGQESARTAVVPQVDGDFVGIGLVRSF